MGDANDIAYILSVSFGEKKSTSDMWISALKEVCYGTVEWMMRHSEINKDIYYLNCKIQFSEIIFPAVND